MSRYYQMSIKVSGVTEDKMPELLRALTHEFWINEAENKLEEWELSGDEYFDKDSEGNYWFWLTEEGPLNGGESEEEFAVRVHKKVWETCPEAEVVIRATWLDELPYEEYSFDREEIE